MPYKFDTDKKKIGRENNKNVKLSDSEREEIKSLYGTISQRKLAKMFKVSRRLIIFVACPEKYKHSKELYKERRKDGRYYKKDRHTIAIKKCRLHKKELFGITRKSYK